MFVNMVLFCMHLLIAAAAEGWAKLHAALGELGMSARGEEALHKLLRAVLLLGQLDFAASDGDGAGGGGLRVSADAEVLTALGTLLGEDVVPDLEGHSMASPRTLAAWSPYTPQHMAEGLLR